MKLLATVLTRLAHSWKTVKSIDKKKKETEKDKIEATEVKP